MKKIKENDIEEIFYHLNQSSLNYILMWNIDNELPAQLEVGKDIDILIHKNEENLFLKFLFSRGYKEVAHPYKSGVYLYGADRFRFLYNQSSEILFDLNFQLVVQSLDDHQWIPLDQALQNSVWENKEFINISKSFGYWAMSNEDEFVTLVARSIFVKRKFHSNYINRINSLLSSIDMADVEFKLNKIFFKYTALLLEQIHQGKYDSLIKNYIAFKDY